MTLVTARWPDVVDAVVAGLRAVDGCVGPDDDGPGVVVFDAWEVAVSGVTDTGVVDGDGLCTWVSVGWPGDPSAPSSSGQSTQDVRAIAAGTRPRQETGSVAMCVQSSWGDGEPSRLRGAAFAALALVETWLRSTSPPLGTAGVGQATVEQIVVDQQSTPSGAYCRIEFEIVYSAHLGTS